MLREKEMDMDHEMDELRAENRLLHQANDKYVEQSCWLPLQKTSAEEMSKYSYSLKGDVDRVALQRELTEKAKRIREWQTRYDQLEDKFRSISEAHHESVRAMEGLNSQLKHERQRNAELERVRRDGEFSKNETKEVFTSACRYFTYVPNFLTTIIQMWYS